MTGFTLAFRPPPFSLLLELTGTARISDLDQERIHFSSTSTFYMNPLPKDPIKSNEEKTKDAPKADQQTGDKPMNEPAKQL